MKLASQIAQFFRPPAGEVHHAKNTSPNRLVAFVHAVGGAGATTLAVNTAFALNPGRVNRASCLLDLDIQFGRAARLLDMPASRGMELLIENRQAVEANVFEHLLTPHGSGLQVLTSPRLPLPLTALKRSAVQMLVQSCLARFPAVTVDMPVALTAWTDIVLKSAARIYFVTPVSVPAAHAARMYLMLLDQHGLGKLPMKIVVIRRPASDRKHEISIDKFQEAVGRPVDVVIPEEFELVQRSHNEGVPLMSLAPRSHLARAVGDLTHDITRARAPDISEAVLEALLRW